MSVIVLLWSKLYCYIINNCCPVGSYIYIFLIKMNAIFRSILYFMAFLAVVGTLLEYTTNDEKHPNYYLSKYFLKTKK